MYVPLLLPLTTTTTTTTPTTTTTTTHTHRYVLLCGYPPFYGDTDAEIFASVKRGHFEFRSPEWDDISSAAKAMIGRLLEKDPNKRLTAEESLQHVCI
jgi:serine/threonine protein kinase